MKGKTVTLEDTELAKVSQKREDAFIQLVLVKNLKLLENAYTKKESSDSSDNADTPKKKSKSKNKGKSKNRKR